MSNARIKPKGDVCTTATEAGAAGLAFVRIIADGQLEGAKPIREGLNVEQTAALVEACAAQEGDLLLLAAGKSPVVNKCDPPVLWCHSLSNMSQRSRSCATQPGW